MKKVIVVGGGHNGLVTAAYLAKAGCNVRVFERRKVVGGCASSDSETFPGYTISTAAYLLSLLLPEIVRDLELEKFGYYTYPRDPHSFTPLLDGSYLMLGSDPEFNKREISKFSKKDAETYPRYEETLAEIADWAQELMKMTPPNVSPKNTRDWKNSWRAIMHASKLTNKQKRELARLVFGDPVEYLDSWFEADVLKATLLTDALIGATELNSYVFFHHGMGGEVGTRGAWSYVRGGMGGLSEALRRAAKSYGAIIETEKEVVEIRTSREKAIGVMVRDKKGMLSVVNSDIVVSNLDPVSTFQKLHCCTRKLERAEKKVVEGNYGSASMKINCTLNRLPKFYACPRENPGPQHRGTIHLAPSVEYILRAMEEGKSGVPSKEPILEITIPSVYDETLAPEGKHVMNIFVQPVPYRKSWSGLDSSVYLTNIILPAMRRFIGNVDTMIDDVQMLSPRDLEKEFGLTGGNIFHGALSRDQLFSLRPIRGMADYRTPIKHLYLCGSGTHPGGGVTGAPGYNAAREILSDLQTA